MPGVGMGRPSQVSSRVSKIARRWAAGASVQEAEVLAIIKQASRSIRHE